MSASRKARRGRLNAYRCPVSDTFWHIGHPPPDLTSGAVARAQLQPRNPEKRRKA